MKDELLENNKTLNQSNLLTSSEMKEEEEIGTLGTIDWKQSQEEFSKPEPRILRIVSGLQQVNRDKWWQLMDVPVSNFKMDEEWMGSEWRQLDFFELNPQQEDFLGSSQLFGSS